MNRAVVCKKGKRVSPLFAVRDCVKTNLRSLKEVPTPTIAAILSSSIYLVMARNEEKAQSMLSRYLRTKQEASGARQRRPYLSTLCDDVDEAEKWRLQVLSDIRRLAEEIQNPGLDDDRVRELNDSINKLLRERGHWERRIRYLGGRDYGRRSAVSTTGLSYTSFPSSAVSTTVEHNGYFYFGEAKRLPEVQGLLAAKEQKRKERLDDEGLQRRMTEMYARVDQDYYGHGDGNDKELERVENKAEKDARAKLVVAWEEQNNATKDEPWDDSYLQFVGKKPQGDFAQQSGMEALILERKKLEALEQLEMGSLPLRIQKDGV